MCRARLLVPRAVGSSDGAVGVPTGNNVLSASLYENQVPDVICYLLGGHMVEDYRGADMAPPKRKASPARVQ